MKPRRSLGYEKPSNAVVIKSGEIIDCSDNAICKGDKTEVCEAFIMNLINNYNHKLE